MTCLFLSFKYIFLFCRHDLSQSSPFDSTMKIIQNAIPSWRLSRHKFISNNFGDNVGCCRSCLYLSPVPISIPSLFSSPLIPTFPSTLPWISSIFNSHSFRLLTTTNLSSIQDSTYPCPSFDKVKVYVFTNNGDSIPLTSNHAICDPTYPVPEPNFHSSDGIFDRWFGIPFSTDNSLTHIRAPYPIEILALY